MLKADINPVPFPDLAGKQTIYAKLGQTVTLRRKMHTRKCGLVIFRLIFPLA